MPHPDPVEVEIQVDADPAATFAVAADLVRMGERSPETYKVRFKGGVTEPGPGVKFRGFNRNGWHWWTSSAKVTEFEPERALAFDVSVMGLSNSRWSFRVEPTEKGCRLTERWESRQNPLLRPRLVGWLVTGYANRTARNDETMRATLEAIKAEVESAG